ncbi:MAG: hypothetical protein NOU37_09315 [Candidatus Brocadiales bacterium]|nr:hypothetical protein [Candidatus Bathyanammoxibius amoris]
MPVNVAKAAVVGASIGLTVASGGLASPLAAAAIGAAFAGGTLGIGLLAQEELAPAKTPDLQEVATRSSLPRAARDRKIMIRSSTEPQRIVYGETVISGPIVAAFGDDEVQNKEYLHLVIALAGHELSAISDVWVGDTLSTNARFSDSLRIKLHLGDDNQAADADLVSEVFDWTTDHRLRGLAYAYVRLRVDADVWINGLPNFKFKVQGRKVYDPRTGQTVYSNNAALCQRDYIKADFGIEAPQSKIDTASWIATANICDEDVPLDGGGTQKRYTCNGSFTLDNRPIDIMTDLLTASVGFALFRQGKYRGYAGAWSTPNTKTFNEDDLIGPITVQTKIDKRNSFNAVRGRYIDEDEDYQLTDFPAVTSTAYEAQDGGLRAHKDIELPFTSNSPCTQRIAKIHLERSRLGIVITAPMKMTAYEVSPWEVIKLSNSKMGWNEKTFRVLKRTLMREGGIELVLQEEVATVWGWSSSEEQTLPAVPTPTLPDPYTVATPTNLALESGAAQLLQQGDGTVVSRIKVSWTLVPDWLVLSGGNYEIQFKKSADSSYSTAAILPGDVSFSHIAGVQDGVKYDVRVRAINNAGVKGSWATVTDHTVIGKTGSPSIPTGLTAIPFITAIGLSWNVNPENDIAGYEIQRADDPGFTTAVTTISRPLSLTYVDEQLAKGTAKYYRIRALNRSGVFSGWTAGVSAATFGVGTDVFDTVDLDALRAAGKLVGVLRAAEMYSGVIQAYKMQADNLAANIIKAGHLDVSTAVITQAIQIANALIGTAQMKNLAVTQAKIDYLQVGTLQIANEAVTVDSSFSLDADVALGGVDVETEVGTITMSTNGGTVLVFGKLRIRVVGAGDFGHIRLRKDSLSGPELDYTGYTTNVLGAMTLIGKDSSPAGTQTYKLTMTALTSNGQYTFPSHRRMLVLNRKK